MTTYKQYSASKVAAAVAVGVSLLATGSVALAQSVYTSPGGVNYSVPAGYNNYNYGTYYNSSSGMYFDPITGQTSSSAPVGPAPLNNGVYTLPAGYNSSVYGTYYNPSTGMWYDPVSGFYSSSAPVGPNASASTPVSTPTLPNTGAGGEAAINLAILASTAAIAAAGVAVLGKKKVLGR